MKITKRTASSIPKEQAHGGSGARKVYASPDHLKSTHLDMMTHGYLPAGQVFDWHDHQDIEEIMVVLKGEGKVADEDGEYPYAPGDVIIFPANTKHKVVNDSRYIPFTQQDSCCVPTSIQMIMYRHGIPLIPAEELGYHLGLTVPPEDASLFHKARVSPTPPSSAGYGTQIFKSEYDPNKIFKKLGIPLEFSKKLAVELNTEENLLNELRKIEESDTDALLCFNHGVVRGKYEPNSGHVVVFDRVIDGKVRIVDASWKQPKWRLIEPSLLLDAIKRHGNENSGGIWYFVRA